MDGHGSPWRRSCRTLAPVAGDEPAGDRGGKLWGVDEVPNRGLALADDRVADVPEVALALGRNATAPPVGRARAGLGEVRVLGRKRGRHTGPPLRPPGATAIASPFSPNPKIARV
jgi:hypothetical protein